MSLDDLAQVHIVWFKLYSMDFWSFLIMLGITLFGLCKALKYPELSLALYTLIAEILDKMRRI